MTSFPGVETTWKMPPRQRSSSDFNKQVEPWFQVVPPRQVEPQMCLQRAVTCRPAPTHFTTWWNQISILNTKNERISNPKFITPYLQSKRHLNKQWEWGTAWGWVETGKTEPLTLSTYFFASPKSIKNIVLCCWFSRRPTIKLPGLMSRDIKWLLKPKKLSSSSLSEMSPASLTEVTTHRSLLPQAATCRCSRVQHLAIARTKELTNKWSSSMAFSVCRPTCTAVLSEKRLSICSFRSLWRSFPSSGITMKI